MPPRDKQTQARRQWCETIAKQVIRQLTKSMQPGTSQWKRNPRFGECYTCFGCETKNGGGAYFDYFSRQACLAISLNRSRRELSIDVAEHRSTMKNYENSHYLRFSFIPNTSIAFPKMGGLFLLWLAKTCLDFWARFAIASFGVKMEGRKVEVENGTDRVQSGRKGNGER